MLPESKKSPPELTFCTSRSGLPAFFQMRSDPGVPAPSALSSCDLQRSRVTLRSELADDLPPVAGDRVQLQQVILNLLRNASDAMRSVEDRPRWLVIRTQRDEDDSVRLTVTDAGAGIEP